jgi:hypothetical protein
MLTHQVSGQGAHCAWMTRLPSTIHLTPDAQTVEVAVVPKSRSWEALAEFAPGNARLRRLPPARFGEKAAAMTPRRARSAAAAVGHSYEK